MIAPKLLRIIIISLAVTSGHSALAATHEYTVTLDDERSILHVEARLDGRVTRLSARSDRAVLAQRDMRNCDTGAALRVRSRNVSSTRAVACLAYSVDIDRLDNRYGSADQALVLPITQWMWRPRLTGRDEIIVTFNLPDGTGVSVPWQPLEENRHRYRLVSSPQSGTGLAVFGDFTETRVPVAGAELRVVAVPAGRDSVGPEFIDWTRKAADHLALTYGRFPNPNARVLLFPSRRGWGSSTVRFGRVVRDGGETIELLVDPRGSEAGFVGEWTATHEFSHLMLPYVTRSQRWISEGFAQYYQNVLLARAGHYSEEDAWEKIREGLERGRESSPSLSPNQAAAGGIRNSRMKIYWSGAALALMADIELRRQSGGELSLDAVLDRMQSCCLPSRRTWTGRELFEQFDELAGGDVFTSLYDRYADARGFPDFDRYLDDPALAEIRAAITARRYTDASGT